MAIQIDVVSNSQAARKDLVQLEKAMTDVGSSANKLSTKDLAQLNSQVLILIPKSRLLPEV